MALVDLKTDLKSLKYGLDRRGMGSSKEPFITKTIPEGETPGATLDVLLRQGSLASGVDDASRLTQLLFSTTKGLAFTANTNLLSRTSVKTEATLGPAYAGGTINQGVYLPTSTIAQATSGFSGTHLNLLGIDPSSPIAGVVEGGLFPAGGLIRYEQVTKEYNNSENSEFNRLVSLRDTKILDNIFALNPLVSNNPLEILSYKGGPGSILGVGSTTLKRATSTVTLNTAYKNPNGTELTYNTIDEDTGFGREFKSNPNFKRYRYGDVDSNLNYAKDKLNRFQNQTLNEGKDLTGLSIGEEQLFKFYLQFISPPSDNTDGTSVNYLYWQAYVDNFSDSIGAKYNSYNYIGRGYPLYKYDEFSRKISLDFTIVADNSTQIIPIYEKLNTLIQFMAPNYSNSGRMRGNFVKLTFGDYLNSVPGIVKGFSLNPIFDVGFDIGTGENSSGKQLPKGIKVDGFNFTPITDNKSQLVSSNSTFISY